MVDWGVLVMLMLAYAQHDPLLTKDKWELKKEYKKR